MLIKHGEQSFKYVSHAGKVWEQCFINLIVQRTRRRGNVLDGVRDNNRLVRWGNENYAE